VPSRVQRPRKKRRLLESDAPLLPQNEERGPVRRGHLRAQPGALFSDLRVPQTKDRAWRPAPLQGGARSSARPGSFVRPVSRLPGPPLCTARLQAPGASFRQHWRAPQEMSPERGPVGGTPSGPLCLRRGHSRSLRAHRRWGKTDTNPGEWRPYGGPSRKSSSTPQRPGARHSRQHCKTPWAGHAYSAVESATAPNKMT